MPFTQYNLKINIFQVFTEENKRTLEEVFPEWQREFQNITEIYDLELFETDVQVRTDTAFNLLGELIKKHNHYLKRIEYSEMIAKNCIKKTKKSIERARQKLKNKRVKLLIKRKLQNLNKELKIYQTSVMEQQKIKSDYYKEKREIQKFKQELQQELEILQLQIEDKKQQLFKGLTPARIQQFHQFLADKQLVGKQCGVCLEDIEFGRKIIRLDCNGHHVFCQDCVEGWFSNHNTCPNCRHTFA